MRLATRYWLPAVFLLFLYSCRKADLAPANENKETPVATATIPVVYAKWPEGFETGTKTNFSTETVTLNSGAWIFSDALIGTTTLDRKNGRASLRIQQNGSVSMNFDLLNGASLVTVYHAVYGNEASATWQLYVSQDAGISWMAVGDTVSTHSKTLAAASFTVNFIGKLRLRVKKLGGGLLNIDDIGITDNSTTPSRDDNLALGNPSAATSDPLNANNYLLVKPQYALSYNNPKGEANWVSWHLSAAWKGTTTRCDCFKADTALPNNFYKVVTTDYTNSGFDRGHLCPSDDRDGSPSDNAVTFLMPNIAPQAPILNQQTWAGLENYCRGLLGKGYEMYIIAGGYGTGGTGSLGGFTNQLSNGRVNVYARYWKIIVVLPVGNNDVGRINNSTRVIAVDMPNNQTVNTKTWGSYRVSVSSLQNITGYDFLSKVPASVQSALEAAVDSGPTQ